MTTKEILKVPFHPLTSQAALDTLLGFLKTDRNHLIVTPNPEAVMLAQRDEGFMRVLQNADLALPDGIGIILAAKWKKIPISTRVTGCDITINLLSAAKGHTCYLLGAAPGVAEGARLELQKEGVNVIGAHHGYLSKDVEKKILAEIQALKPDILLIGMGMPRQEEWAAANLHTLPCKITLCIGGAIDILAKRTRRAPKIMRRLGFEWLYRFLCDPTGRAKRMLDLPRFVWIVLTEPKQTFPI